MAPKPRWYGDTLDELAMGLRFNAVDLPTAFSTYSGLDDLVREQHQEQRQARRQAGLEAQEGLSKLAFSEAQQGTPMSGLLDLARSQTGMPFDPVPGMTPSAQLKSMVPGLDDLYESGLSTVKPILDDEDQRAILEDLANGVPPEQIYAGIESAYPDQYAALLPQLDTLIKAARTRTTLGG